MTANKNITTTTTDPMSLRYNVVSKIIGHMDTFQKHKGLAFQKNQLPFMRFFYKVKMMDNVLFIVSETTSQFHHIHKCEQMIKYIYKRMNQLLIHLNSENWNETDDLFLADQTVRGRVNIRILIDVIEAHWN